MLIALQFIGDRNNASPTLDTSHSLLMSFHSQVELIMKYKDGKTTVNPQPNKRCKMVLDGETGMGPQDDTMPLQNQAPDEVSDGGSEFSMDSHEAEDIIEDGHGSGVVPSPKDTNCNSTAFDNLISDEYCEEEVVPSLPPIDEKLAIVLTKWLRVCPPREKIKEMFKECMLPSNVDGLKPVRINAIVYNRLTSEMKQNDQKLRGLNTFLARGLGPIVNIWNNILKWKANVGGHANPDVRMSMGVIESGNLSLDITEIRQQLDKSIRLLATCHSVLVDCRRQSLCHLFDNKFAYLFKESNPATLELLGDNVDQKVVQSVNYLKLHNSYILHGLSPVVEGASVLTIDVVMVEAPDVHHQAGLICIGQGFLDTVLISTLKITRIRTDLIAPVVEAKVVEAQTDLTVVNRHQLITPVCMCFVLCALQLFVLML